MTVFALGDRVRTLVLLTSNVDMGGCDMCRDLPIGSLGTVDYVSPPLPSSRPPRPFDGCGVLFDDDHHQLSCWMKPDEIEKEVPRG